MKALIGILGLVFLAWAAFVVCKVGAWVWDKMKEDREGVRNDWNDGF